MLTLVCAALALQAEPESADPLESMMAADRAFAARAAEAGLAEAFREYAAEDARLLQPGGADLVGPDAIFESRSAIPDETLLWWAPRGGYVDPDGEFGATYGGWELHPDGDRETAPAATGDYLTVWRREADGQWRYVVDTGNVDPSPAAAEPEAASEPLD